MSKTVMFSVTAVAALALSAAASAADPSSHQIYEALQSGQLAQAQQMVGQVLQDHPDSARAHYIAAEVDARIGDLGAARQELSRARGLDPKLSFVDAHSVTELTAQLNGRAAGARVVSPGVVPGFAQPHRSSVPWTLLLVLGAGGLLLWSLFRRRQQAAYYPSQSGVAQPYGGVGPGGLGGGYGTPYPPQAGGMGSGIMGGLATGLAVGAGVAAGEALVDHMLDGREHGSPGIQNDYADLRESPANQDLGGNDFGVSDGGGWGDNSGGGWGDSGGGGDDWV